MLGIAQAVLTAAAALLLLAMTEHRVAAAPNAYTGPDGGDWFEPTYWALGHVPTAGDDIVTIDGSVAPSGVAFGASITDAGYAQLMLTNGARLIGADGVSGAFPRIAVSQTSQSAIILSSSLGVPNTLTAASIALSAGSTLTLRVTGTSGGSDSFGAITGDAGSAFNLTCSGPACASGVFQATSLNGTATGSTSGGGLAVTLNLFGGLFNTTSLPGGINLQSLTLVDSTFTATNGSVRVVAVAGGSTTSGCVLRGTVSGSRIVVARGALNCNKTAVLSPVSNLFRAAGSLTLGVLTGSNVPLSVSASNNPMSLLAVTLTGISDLSVTGNFTLPQALTIPGVCSNTVDGAGSLRITGSTNRVQCGSVTVQAGYSGSGLSIAAAGTVALGVVSGSAPISLTPGVASTTAASSITVSDFAMGGAAITVLNAVTVSGECRSTSTNTQLITQVADITCGAFTVGGTTTLTSAGSLALGVVRSVPGLPAASATLTIAGVTACPAICSTMSLAGTLKLNLAVASSTFTVTGTAGIAVGGLTLGDTNNGARLVVPGNMTSVGQCTLGTNARITTYVFVSSSAIVYWFALSLTSARVVCVCAERTLAI